MQINRIDSLNFTQRKLPNKDLSSIKRAFEEKIGLYPKDYEYIKTLGKAINLPTSELYKLNSIIGEEELTSILQNVKRADFIPPTGVPGKALTTKQISQYADSNFHISLHMHSTNSDGVMTIGSLLRQAADYANAVKPFGQAYNFIIATTDHDTLEGAKKALKLIVKSPEKYKNLGVVLGTELSAAFRDTEMLAKPVPYELIAYSINPFEKDLGKSLSSLRNNRISLSKQIISEANELYPQYNFSYEEVCKESKNPKKGIDGFLYPLAEYLDNKSSGITGIKEMCLKYLPQITPVNDKITNSAENLFSELGDFGFLGVAHPGKIYLGGGRIKEDFIKKCKENGVSAGKVIIERFFESLKNIGKNRFKAAEINYQAYRGSLSEAQEVLNGNGETTKEIIGSVNWLKNIIKLAQEHNLLRTGGIDTHKENPFLKN